MLGLKFIHETNYSSFKNILPNRINKIKNTNLKNLYRKDDPVNIIESYVHFKNWIVDFSELYRNFLMPILIPFATLVLIDLLKKNFLIEAKFFSVIFVSDLDEAYKISSDWLNYKSINLKNQIKNSFIGKGKVFCIELPPYLFAKLVFFFENSLYLHFLKYINKYFKVKFLSNYMNFTEKSQFSLQILPIKNNTIQILLKNNLDLNKSNLSNNKIKLFNHVKKKLKFYKTLKIFCKNLDLINSVSMSSDENTVVAGLENSTIRVFDFINNSNKSLSYSLSSHSASVSCVKISTCNNFFISSSMDGELNLWSLEYKKKLLNFENFNKPIWDISFSHKEKLFSTACGDSLSALWVTDRLFPLRFFVGHKSDINVTRWHPSNLIMATGSDDNTVRLWDIKNAKSIYSYKNFDSNVYNIEFSSDGFEMCISGLTNYVDILDLRTGKKIKRVKDTRCKNNIKSLAYSPNGCFLVHDVNSKIIKFIARKNLKNNKFKSFNFEKNRILYSFGLNFQKIFQIRFNSNEKITIIGI